MGSGWDETHCGASVTWCSKRLLYGCKPRLKRKNRSLEGPRVIKNSTAEIIGTTDGRLDVAVRSSSPSSNGSAISNESHVKRQMKPKSEFCEPPWHFRDLLDALPAAIYTTDAA